MMGQHDGWLVVLALTVAVCASYTSLDLARRSRHSAVVMRKYWLGAASFALGGGIWAMHFVAMLAFQTPGMPMSYDVALTALSFALAVGFTGLGFAIFSQDAITIPRLIMAAALMALGIIAMHYVGMAAMQVSAHVVYDVVWVLLSILIAITAAIASLLLASRDHSLLVQAVAACFMGLAISGMHFAGMNAATFHAVGHIDGAGFSVRQGFLAIGIGLLTCLILAIGTAAARLDAFVQTTARRASRVALRLEIADVLRSSGQKSALDQVAMLMGKHFGVNRTGYGLLDRTSDEFDYEICWTDGTVPALLGRYPAKAFGEKIVAALSNGTTVAIANLFENELSSEPATHATASDVDTRAILVVPFVSDGKLLSIVYLNSQSPRDWHRDDIAFMEELAERTRLVIERDQALRRLLTVNAELETRVEERTSELREAQQALLQSQKMEAVGQLAAGLAHDFNNVLSGAMGALELIGRKPADVERVKRYAKAGIEALTRGSRLTGQLLSFSRLQAINLKPVVICEVIEGLTELLKGTLGSMIDLRFELNPHPVPVIGDTTQLEMMVLNLAINARDAMASRGTLTIATRVTAIEGDHELDDGEYVELAVADTGHGMDEETLRRATEPFFTTKPVGKGTGLGLAQIYASARKAGGTVRLESSVGQGTVVRVYLRKALQTADKISDGKTASPAALSPLHIAVVDDDPACSETLREMLIDEGHSVKVFPGGPEFLADLAADPPDLFILDYAMPEMNGAVLARRIHELWPEAAIIFATGYADSEDMKRVIGADAPILEKPVSFAKLKLVLAKVRANLAGPAVSELS
ncbi:response regulator [Novosphingobium sp. ERN07]|uniref:MHYT domain-containing protein n=1 Tax=Novosphingobium sp. ERN07 TaxID=2726187 RepID=UPI00145789F3|nr:MHYT domain-containing protein [Novosphingobium sp. ERN07]NLR70926.1 response regulator [Novosphingobium sp. ERN07]